MSLDLVSFCVRKSQDKLPSSESKVSLLSRTSKVNAIGKLQSNADIGRTMMSTVLSYSINGTLRRSKDCNSVLNRNYKK